MALEIERKFLVKSDVWRERVTATYGIVQCYLPSGSGTETRIREIEVLDIHTGKCIRGPMYKMTVKTPTDDPRVRHEHEMIISHVFWNALMDLALVSVYKIRHCVTAPNGLVWEIDEYPDLEDAEGNIFTTAEIEIPDPDYELVLPDFVGEEVTGDKEFANRTLALPINDQTRSLYKRPLKGKLL